MSDLIRVRGAGGGSSGGSKKSSNGNAPNTLRSKARASLIEILSEGPIKGLVNGAKSIYFNQTPLQNADGSYNFQHVIWEDHKGYADEGYFNGFPAVETPVAVGVAVTTAVPVVRTIVDVNADALRVIAQIPALVSRDASSGAIGTASVSYAIDVRPAGGSYTTVLTNNIVNQKNTSPYQIAHRIPLPAGGSPWDVRFRRITADSTDANLQNGTTWDSYVVLVEGKFILPWSAAVALEVNAEDMGSTLPPRNYLIDGLLVNVPTNYDPDTRVYTGIWDGTFKLAWTDNPAWVFYDLIINDRYGLGEFVNAAAVDKWGLYAIAQYCDQLVNSGFKDGSGDPIMEPRYTFNGVISTADDAYFVLQQIATTWRGMGYWAIGQVFATADMPADPFKIVAPANIIGNFEYSGTAKKARHTVALVTWNDPANFYQRSTELVIDNEALKRYGWVSKTVQLLGCNSRGLARRYGKWILDTEQNETETVQYQAGLDHMDVRPGHIIAIADPRKAAVRLGGRIVSHVGNVVTLDQAFAPTTGADYTLMLIMPSGELVSRAITSFSGAAVTVATPFPDTADVHAMFGITGDVTLRRYRILTIDEPTEDQFKITALFHDPTKYARVEQNISFEPPIYSRPTQVSYPPTGGLVTEVSHTTEGKTVSTITLSWQASTLGVTRSYLVSMDHPTQGHVDLGTVYSPTIDIEGAIAGGYVFYIQGVGLSTQPSPALSVSYTAVGPNGIPLPTVSDLILADRPASTEFVGRDVFLAWKNNFATTTATDATGITPTNDTNPLYRFNTIQIFEKISGLLLRTQRVTTEHFTYTYDMNRADSLLAGLAGASRSLHVSVTVQDVLNRTSTATTADFANTKPDLITPTVSAVDRVITVAWPNATDLDLAGSLVWIETNDTFDPATTTPAFDGTGNSFVFYGDFETDYYVRFASYDLFDKVGLNVSTAIHVTTDSSAALSQEIMNIVGPLMSSAWDKFAEFDVVLGDLAQVVMDNSVLTQKKVTGLTVRNDSAAAGVLRVEQVAVTALQASASVSDEVTAVYNNLSAGGMWKTEAVVDAMSGLVTILFKVQATDGTFTSEAALQLGASVTGPGVTQSYINFMADRMNFISTGGSYVSSPFYISSGKVVATEFRFEHILSLDGTSVEIEGRNSGGYTPFIRVG